MTTFPIFIGAKGIILLQGNKVIASNIGQGLPLSFNHCESIKMSCLYGIVDIELITERRNSSNPSSLHYNTNWYTTIKSIRS